jgi:hypothetical protein
MLPLWLAAGVSVMILSELLTNGRAEMNWQLARDAFVSLLTDAPVFYKAVGLDRIQRAG